MKLLRRQTQLFLITVVFAAVAVSHVFASAPTYAPDNLNLTALSYSEIKLEWTVVTADPAVTGYKIERESPIGGGFTAVTNNTGSAVRIYTDVSLSSGVQYSYRVSAVNSDGTGPASSQIVAVTTLAPVQLPPPSRPQNFTATPISGSAIKLSWAASLAGDGVTGYLIERSVSGDFATIVSNTSSTSTEYTDANLSAGGTYGYRVSARNAYGVSSPTAGVYAATLLSPGAPRDVKAVAGNSQATISWQPPLFDGGDIFSYVILWAPSSSLAVSGAATSTVIIGLTNGTTYYFRIYTVNKAGESPIVLANNAVTPSTTTLPTPPPSSSQTQEAPTSSVSALEEQIKVLRAMIEALNLQVRQTQKVSTSPSASTGAVATTTPSTMPSVSPLFARNLYIGLSGNDVLELQKFLVSESKGSAARELEVIGPTGYFGQLTKKALTELQVSAGIEPASGYFGSITRAYVKKIVER